jgi:glycosyltransferase involved in cell wall biosynthesis
MTEATRATILTKGSGHPLRHTGALDRFWIIRRIRRILYVSHSKEVGGAELYLAGLIGSVAAAGPAAPALVCRRDAVLDEWAARVASGGVSVHRLDLTAPGEYLALVRLARGADLVHLNLAFPVGRYQLVAAALARLAGRRLVVTHHLGVDVAGLPLGARARRFWTAAFPLYDRLARWNVACSRAVWDHLVRGCGFSARRTVLVRNGADLDRFQPLAGAERAGARAEAAEAAGLGSLPPGAVLACTVARLSVQKGLADLVDAARIVAADHPDVRFVVVGDGELREEVAARASAAGLAGRLGLAGARPQAQVARWLGAADLFVLPSHFEGMPLALIEAMAAGCAPVATDVGGVGEVVGGPAVGRLVPPRNPVALAAAIGELAADADLRGRLSCAASERARAAFDVRETYRETAGLYGV